MSSAEAADLGLGVHDEIDDGRIPAIPFLNLQPTRNVGVSAFVAGGTRDRVVETAVQGAKFIDRDGECLFDGQRRHSLALNRGGFLVGSLWAMRVSDF